MNRQIELAGFESFALLATERMETLAAIGYLATYALHPGEASPYSKVTIVANEKHGEMIAVYTAGAPTTRPIPSFTLGAFWRSDRREFSFHS